MCGIGRPVAHLLGALVAQHYNGGDGTTVDAVHENWPAASCSDGECAGWAGNDWLVPTADLKAGLSIGTPVPLVMRVAVPSIPACVACAERRRLRARTSHQIVVAPWYDRARKNCF